MDLYEENAKRQAEKAAVDYLRQNQTMNAYAGVCDQQQTGAQRQLGTRERLMSRLRASNGECDRLNRAVAILEAHPEFEDLIWLLNAGVL